MKLLITALLATRLLTYQISKLDTKVVAKYDTLRTIKGTQIVCIPFIFQGVIK
ncbi:hypothetical protein [Francisella tularensis]|uniref:hypothetical protein n=1 Tax=Francisella tularensis TaxID=263 RepID=UPI0012DB2541|nr:hypothetical protein [Francisella tularensis]MBK2335037.1 hypothetical protein [Francisella tularensis subsp. novicida]